MTKNETDRPTGYVLNVTRLKIEFKRAKGLNTATSRKRMRSGGPNLSGKDADMEHACSRQGKSKLSFVLRLVHRKTSRGGWSQ